MALVFYHKDMLEKVAMQRTQQFSAFSLLPKEPNYMQRMRSKSKYTSISREPPIRISRN